MYVDNNVLVYAIFDGEERGKKSRQLLKVAKNAITSVLTLDEFMRVVRREAGNEKVRKSVEKVYSMPTLTIVGVEANTARHAALLAEQHNLKPRDAMHIAIMQALGEKEILSDDSDFDRVKGIRRIPVL